jgi:hypothetical protein
VTISKKNFEQFSWSFKEPMEVKVSTVDNMATLPASSRSEHNEKNAAAIKEMEIKNVIPKPLERWIFRDL